MLYIIVYNDKLDFGLYLAYFMEQYQRNVDIEPLFEVNIFLYFIFI